MAGVVELDRCSIDEKKMQKVFLYAFTALTWISSRWESTKGKSSHIPICWRNLEYVIIGIYT